MVISGESFDIKVMVIICLYNVMHVPTCRWSQLELFSVRELDRTC